MAAARSFGIRKGRPRKSRALPSISRIFPQQRACGSGPSSRNTEPGRRGRGSSQSQASRPGRKPGRGPPGHGGATAGHSAPCHVQRAGLRPGGHSTSQQPPCSGAKQRSRPYGRERETNSGGSVKLEWWVFLDGRLGWPVQGKPIVVGTRWQAVPDPSLFSSEANIAPYRQLVKS